MGQKEPLGASLSITPGEEYSHPGTDFNLFFLSSRRGFSSAIISQKNIAGACLYAGCVHSVGNTVQYLVLEGRREDRRAGCVFSLL
jgi:hypothetical protein